MYIVLCAYTAYIHVYEPLVSLIHFCSVPCTCTICSRVSEYYCFGSWCKHVHVHVWQELDYRLIFIIVLAH